MKKRFFWWIFGILYVFLIFKPLLNFFMSKDENNCDGTKRNDGWKEVPMIAEVEEI